SVRVKPWPTPRTMLSISLRVRPCTLRARRVSPRRWTLTASASTATCTSASISRSSLPFGPSTRTRPSVTWTFTPAGSFTGIFPIRDIEWFLCLPDGADDLAADVLATRGAIDEHAFRGGEHVHAEPLAHRGDVAHADVDAETRAAHPPDAADHRA